MSKSKIKIVGKNAKFYIGFLPIGVYVFAPASVVENRIVTDPQVYQLCKNVIFTNTEYDNFENANLFLKSNYFPDLFKDQCFELNTSLHHISLVLLSGEKNGLFAFRSNILYLNFSKPFDNTKLNRIILKVIGTREFKFEERNTFYPYYQAIQIE